MSLIPGPGRWRQVDFYKLEASLVYRVPGQSGTPLPSPPPLQKNRKAAGLRNKGFKYQAILKCPWLHLRVPSLQA